MSDFYLPPDDDDEPHDDSSERPQDPSGDGETNEYFLEGDSPAEGELRENHERLEESSGSEPSSHDSFPEGLLDRIARITRQGGFDGDLHLSYDDPDANPPGEDWKAILFPDPFARLFLDWRQVESITDQMVTRHAILIQRFWEKRARQVESGAPARPRILRTYGDLSRLRVFERQALDDAEALATPEKRTAVVKARIDTIRTRILARFEDFVLGDRTLSSEESERLLAQADAEGWSRHAAAAFLLAELHRRGFRNASGDEPRSEDGHAAEILLSSSWSTSGKKVLRPEHVIGLALANAMLSGSITAAQIQALLVAAVEAGVDRDVAAEFIAERLGVHEGVWMPAPGEASVKGSLADALASVRWLSPERYAEELRRIREEHRRNFEATVDKTLSGRILTPTKAKELLAASMLDQEEAALIVLNELERRGFQSKRGRAPSGNTAMARLTSSAWIRPSRRNPWLLVGGLAVVTLVILVAKGVFSQDTGRPSDPTAVVDTQRLNVRSSPTDKGGEATIIGHVTLGEKLRVTGYTMNEEGETWLRIDYRKKNGWVSDRYVQFTQYDNTPRIDVKIYGPPVSDPTVRPDSDIATKDSEITPGLDTQPDPSSTIASPDDVYPPSRLDTQPRLRSQVPVLKTPPGGYEGRARVRLHLDLQGLVERAECLSSLSSDLCSRAENAMANLRFDPGHVAGQPVRTWTGIDLRFVAAQTPRQPSCSEAEIEELVRTQIKKASECAVLADPGARKRCDDELNAIKTKLKRCSD